MRVNQYILPAVVIFFLIGSVITANVLGYWQTSGKEMVNLKEFTSDDVKGWMSLQVIADGTGIPLDELRLLLGLPADMPADTALKDIEELIEVTEAKARLAEYLGQPAPAEPEPTATAEPATAAPVEETAPASEPLSTEDIKGRSTLQEVSDSYNIPLDVLYRELNIPDNVPATTSLKDLTARIEGFEVTVVREFVAGYQATNP